MANTKQAKDSKIKRPQNQAIGSQAVPTTLDNVEKLDIDTSKKIIDNIIEAGLTGKLDVATLENFTSISNSRDQLYQLIDSMAADSTVSSIIRTYAEDACEVADNGHAMWCESDDPKISAFVNYLLNVMNVDKNVYSWAYDLIKYGDVYLRLYRESDYCDELFKKDSIQNVGDAKTRLNESVDTEQGLNEQVNLNTHKISDHYSYYVEKVADPGTMFELTKYGRTYGYIETPNNSSNQLSYTNGFLGQVDSSIGAFGNYKMKSNDVNIYQADDFVHACLDDNYSRFPETVDIFLTDTDYKAGANAQSYTVKRGKSMLYDSYKVWREKTLLEMSAMLNRITKSSLVRNIQVEVGDMPKTKVAATLRHVKELFEQKTAINMNSSMSEYTNPGPIENNIYTATHNGIGAITIAETGGDIDVKNLADLDWWNNKFFAAYGIPKQFFGYTSDDAGFSGGSSLSIISSSYSKGVKRIQNALVQMITDAINLFLINRGCKSYLNNFVIKMKTPLSQEERDYREDLTNRISAISNLQSLFGDIEDKSRRLKILRSLLGSLHYGDDLTQILDDEIKEAEKAKIEEKEADDLSDNGGESGELDLTDFSVDSGNASNVAEQQDSDIESNDLGLSSIAAESFSNNEDGVQLAESKAVLVEENDLPNPEDISDIDFTKNV